MKIQAHRGASHIAPDNTIAAFRAAAKLGADGFETDVQLTADEELVIQHNYGIEANSDGKGNVYELTLSELQGFDFGAWYTDESGGHPYAGEHIATLEQCLDVAEELGFGVVNVELKAPMDAGKAGIYVDKVAAEIKKHPVLLPVLIVSGFDHSLLKRLKELIPDLRVGALTTPDMSRLAAIPLGDYIDAKKPLLEYTLEDMKLLPDAVAESLTARVSVLGLRGTDTLSIALEMCTAIGAMLPVGTTWGEAMRILRAQADLVDYVDNVLDFPIDFLHCFYGSALTNPALVEAMHERGIGVNIWTPNDEETLQKVIALNPDGIITDEPAVALRLLGR